MTSDLAAPALHSFAALLFAHVLADFLLQNKWLIDNKHRFGVQMLHAAVVLVTAQAAVGHVLSPELLVLATVHLIIDCVKTYGNFKTLTAFLADQAAHLATVAAIALYAPHLWQSGLWATEAPAAAALLLKAMALAAGLILALRAGDFAIRLLMAAHDVTETDTVLEGVQSDGGLPEGGRSIGYLERLLIFVLVLTGEFAAIGFLVAAKSILRFGTVSNNRRATEYVIIGTLASFVWAIVVALATRALIDLLPALEITALLS